MNAEFENKATLNIDWSITTNILLKESNGSVAINVYGDAAKLIAQARILTGDVATTKYCRFETEKHWNHWNLIAKEDVDSFLSKVRSWCEKHLKDTNYCEETIPTVVTIV